MSSRNVIEVRRICPLGGSSRLPLENAVGACPPDGAFTSLDFVRSHFDRRHNLGIVRHSRRRLSLTELILLARGDLCSPVNKGIYKVAGGDFRYIQYVDRCSRAGGQKMRVSAMVSASMLSTKSPYD